MGQLASREELRMSFVRWALVTVPAILFLGFLVGPISSSGLDSRWFDALVKPDWFPAVWIFPAVWAALYILLGVAIAMILHARGARGRGVAIALFVSLLILNFACPPTFFAAHQVTLTLWLMVLALLLAIATAIAFASIRKAAAWLMAPYLVWFGFATLLAWEVNRLNPDAETLTPEARRTHIEL